MSCPRYRVSIDPKNKDRARAKRWCGSEIVRKIVDRLLPSAVRIGDITTEETYFRVAGGAQVRMLDRQ